MDDEKEERRERIKQELRDYIKYTHFDGTNEETKWRRINMYLDDLSNLENND